VIKPASRLRFAAVAALLASSLLHVGAMAISPKFEADVQIEGSDSDQVAALGSNFADLVKAGDRLDPVETEDSAVATQPTETLPTQPVEAPSDAAKPVTHVTSSTVSPPRFKISPAPSESLVPSAPVETTDPVKPELAAAQPPARQPERVEPETADAQIKPVKAAETVTPVEKPKPTPKPIAKPKNKKPEQPRKSSAGSSKSKSKVSNKSGSQNGKIEARAASSGKSKSNPKSTASGNAAASNYPGKVYAKIARTRQRNAGGRGVAHVKFNVTSSGQAVSISVARSSGNARIDRAAVAHVKRAAPFPKPPAGAQTRFVIPIEFRR